MILDWRHESVACASLGNIATQAFATEYIRDVLRVDVGVIVSEWHNRLWPLFLPSNRIFTEIPENAYVKICECLHDNQHCKGGWIRGNLDAAGYSIDEYVINPRICWDYGRNTKTVLIYPREYHNGNKYYDLKFWIDLCKDYTKKGWEIVAILDSELSFRDGKNSLEWCSLFSKAIPLKYIFPPTIGGLQAGVGLSELAIGIFNGAGWMLLKSLIPQIVLDDPNDPWETQTAKYNLQYTSKYLNGGIELVIGKDVNVKD